MKTERKAAGKWMGMAAFVTLAAIAGGLTVWMWKGRPAEEAFPFHEDFFDWTVTAEVTHIGDHMLEYRTDRLDGVNPGVYRLDADVHTRFYEESGHKIAWKDIEAGDMIRFRGRSRAASGNGPAAADGLSPGHCGCEEVKTARPVSA